MNKPSRVIAVIGGGVTGMMLAQALEQRNVKTVQLANAQQVADEVADMSVQEVNELSQALRPAGPRVVVGRVTPEKTAADLCNIAKAQERQRNKQARRQQHNQRSR